MPSVNLIINCDTRPGCCEESFTVGDIQGETLKGVRSWDFLTDGIRNKIAFFRGWDVQAFIYIDKQEEIPYSVMQEVRSFGMYVVDDNVDHSSYRWNDKLYHRSMWDTLFTVDGKIIRTDYLAHFDGDVVAYASPDSKHLEDYERLLDGDAKYVCQPTTIENHGMRHASTRFFICKTETYDSEEIGKCLDDGYRARKYGMEHCPCFEYILGITCGWKVHYPAADWNQYFMGHLVSYSAGNLAKWNAMPYEEVRDLLTPHLHGPLDLLAKDL